VHHPKLVGWPIGCKGRTPKQGSTTRSLASSRRTIFAALHHLLGVETSPTSEGRVIAGFYT
jgi:hypothetical protein